jgi:hypothetical protein
MAESNDLADAFVDQLYLNGNHRRPDHAQTQTDHGQDGEAPHGPATMFAELPPSRQKTADEVLAEMNKVPLFMTSLQDLDEDNEQIEALKTLAYDGTRAENADNFRNQGNDCVKQKQFQDAREFYSKAIQALKAPPQQPPAADEPHQGGARVVEILDEEEEARKERAIEEACYANRALCNLEMSITSPN